MVFTHEVQTGESLEEIANRFDTTVEEIMAVNDIADPQRLPSRIVIRIPATMLPPSVFSPRPFQNYAVERVGNLLYIFFTDRMFYLRNQAVGLTLIKINLSQEPVFLTYTSSQRFDFYVRRRRNAPVLWQWSAGQNFAQVLDRITIQPGRSQIFRAEWNQETNEGRHVESGVYYIQAENVAQQLRGERLALRIRIA